MDPPKCFSYRFQILIISKTIEIKHKIQTQPTCNLSGIAICSMHIVFAAPDLSSQLSSNHNMSEASCPIICLNKNRSE